MVKWVQYTKIWQKNSGDAKGSEILGVIDSLPFCANRAAVEDKGKSWVYPEMVVVDCNDPEMNFDVTMNNPSAARRRFLFVHPTVKPEYANGTSLDPSKIPEDLEDKMDLWTFEVFRMVPDTLTKSIKINVGPSKHMNIYEFTALLFEEFEKHDEKQESQRKAMEEDVTKYFPKVNAKFSRIYVY